MALSADILSPIQQCWRVYYDKHRFSQLRESLLIRKVYQGLQRDSTFPVQGCWIESNAPEALTGIAQYQTDLQLEY